MSRLRSNQWWGIRDYLRGKTNKTGSKYLQQAFQHLRNKVDYILRKLKSYYTKKIEDNKDNLRNTWEVLEKVINRKGKWNLVNKITVNSTEITNKQELWDEMNKYFSSIGSTLAKGIPEGNLDSISLVEQSQSTFRLKKITPIQIRNLIMKSANGKATGVDIVFNPLLETASQWSHHSLLTFLTSALNMGLSPMTWRLEK